MYKLIDAMENGDSCRVETPQPPYEDADIAINHERTTCTHTNHGELIRYLKTYNYWPPVTKAQAIPLSVNEVSFSSIQQAAFWAHANQYRYTNS